MKGKRFIIILFALLWLVSTGVFREVAQAVKLTLPQTPVKDLLPIKDLLLDMQSR